MPLDEKRLKMEEVTFYFPPKSPSEAFIEARDKLKSKGYAFNESKKMCMVDQTSGKLDETKGFVFEVKKGDHKFNQSNYEEIGEIITDYVFGLMTSDPMNLRKVDLPKCGDKKSFVFISDDFETNEKLCILIHGSGVVRAGQWTRKLIINENLDLGTIMPDIMMAKQRGFAVLVLNTNDNCRAVNGGKTTISGCENAINSALTTWKDYVNGSKHKSIAIIAHSYGGQVSFNLFKDYEDEFNSKVFGVFLTDSAHHNAPSNKTHVKDKWINFCSSNQPLEDALKDARCGMRQMSAGHSIHEWTPSSARSSVFKYFDEYFQRHSS